MERALQLEVPKAKENSLENIPPEDNKQNLEQRVNFLGFLTGLAPSAVVTAIFTSISIAVAYGKINQIEDMDSWAMYIPLALCLFGAFSFGKQAYQRICNYKNNIYKDY